MENSAANAPTSLPAHATQAGAVASTAGGPAITTTSGPATTTASVLQVEGLNVFYGAVQAVSNVSFHVLPGEIFGLLGPNGAGKTSTLSAVEGLLNPSAGTIRVAGFSTKEQPRFARACMGVQLQATSFQPELTVSEILQLFAGIYGVGLTKEQTVVILSEINLRDFADRRYGQLSGGQQQRISLVIATIHNPQLVLLDEPTTGLDPQSRRQLWKRIEAMRDKGHGILLTTHSMEEAESVCDRIAIIDHGKIIVTGTPQAIIEDNRNLPEVIAASRKGRITLEDVFIGLTGTEVRA
jgi:ABC-2 type transport system ATP-binding protein